MELKRYFYKRTLENTHSDYGVVARGVEKCPIGKVKLIGVACTHKDCCKGHARFMRIVENADSWIKCEATTQLVNEDSSLGQQNTCIVN